MPGDKYSSIQNPRMYRALRRRGLSKTSAARISNARTPGHAVKESAAAGLAIPPHGPDALFNQPGMASRRRRKRTKALNWHARGGQTIGGHLRRGGDGRFSGDGGDGSSSDTPRQQRARAKRDTRRRRMDDLRAAREQERADEEAKRAEEDAYIAAGATGRERQRRRSEIAQARRDRAKARRELHQRQIDEERQKRDEEDAAEEAARAQDKKGGGGSGKKKPGDDEKRAEAEKKAAANRAATAPKAGLSAAEAETLRAAAEGGSASAADTRRLRALGLIDDTGATDAGRRLLAALERGDVRGALAAIQDGKARAAREQTRRERTARQQADARRRAAVQARQEAERRRREAAQQAAARRTERERNRTLSAQIIRNLSERRQRRHKEQQTFGGKRRADLPDSVFAGPDRSFPITTAQDVRDAVRSLGRTKHDKAAVKRGIIRRARAIGAVDALPESWKAAKSFAVFKDADGHDRWAAITTTAYQDKDHEWITRKAIRGVVAAGDASGQRGPLRFWHVPGLDLGDCDYQAALDGGRLLLESGTFRSPAAARIGMAAATKGYQMSPGFLHTRQEPRGGAFDHIAIFERSFVPPGRASNPYTQFLTKETRMLTDEKRKEFEALAADDEGRALLESLLNQAAATTKEADAAGAIYKDAPGWAQDLARRMGVIEERVKAFPPAAADTMAAAADEEAAGATDDLAALDAETADDGTMDAGGMDDEAFASMLADRIVKAIAPLFDIEKKMRGMVDELKGSLAPMAAKDDTRASEIAAINARLKELEGDQPRARASLAGGVWGDLTGIPVTKEQAAAIGATPAGGGASPVGLNEAEAGAYKLIYGE